VFREKDSPFKSYATAREAGGSCSSRALDRQLGRQIVALRMNARAVGTKSAGGPIEGRRGGGGRSIVVSFFKEPQSSPSPSAVAYALSSFPSLRGSFLPLLLPLSLPLSFCLPSARRAQVHAARSGGIRFHVYTQNGSDWPGLKPSQITS